MKSKIIKKIMQWFLIIHLDFGLKKIIFHVGRKTVLFKNDKNFDGFWAAPGFALVRISPIMSL